MASRNRPHAAPPNPLPTDAELDILAVLWRIGPAVVRDVHEALGKESGYTTTLKQMQVMTEKGLLTRVERFRSHVYKPAASKEHTRRRIAGDLIRRAFDGSAKSLVVGALESKAASREDLAEICRLLDEFEKRKGTK